MLYIIYAIHVIICLFLILVVLLQQGSGADLSVFGGGGTQTAFGARSATNLLHRLTVAGFIGFILTTIAFGFLKTGGGESVMSDVEQAVASEAADAADGADGAEAEEMELDESAAPAASDAGEGAAVPADAGDMDNPEGADEATSPEDPDGP